MVNGRPGVAPQTAKREEFTRLIAQGLSIAEAVRRVGIHYRTGRRWLRGRTVRLASGVARQYASICLRFVVRACRVPPSGCASAVAQPEPLLPRAAAGPARP